MKPGCTIIGTVVAQPETREELQAILAAFVAPTRAEEGCINYDFHVDADNPCVFVFYETWRSKEDLDRHLTLPHLKPLDGPPGRAARPPGRHPPPGDAQRPCLIGRGPFRGPRPPSSIRRRGNGSTLDRDPIRLGMVGGGHGSFIGAIHRYAARLDGEFQLVAGALSSSPDKARESAAELGIAEDRSYASFAEMAARRPRPRTGSRPSRSSRLTTCISRRQRHS